RPGGGLRRAEPGRRAADADPGAQGAGRARVGHGAPRERPRRRLRLRVFLRDRELGRAVGPLALPDAGGTGAGRAGLHELRGAAPGWKGEVLAYEPVAEWITGCATVWVHP